MNDIVVGRSGTGPDGHRGSAHLFCGATFTHLRVLRRPLGPAYSQETEFGVRVSGIPDVDGDGFGDVIVSAHLDAVPPAAEFSGRAYVYSGATGALLHAVASPDPSFASNFGAMVAGVPDLNGDGRGDFVVTQQGLGVRRVYVFSGATGELIRWLEPPIPGSSYMCFSHVPDVDGDGVADLVLAAMHDATLDEPERHGRAYIYSGATGQLLHTLRSPNAVSRYFGSGARGLEDVDGDGFGDVIAGAEEGNPGDPPRAGSAHVFSGATGELIYSISSPTPTEYGLAAVVAALVDLDGDGRQDVAVGAPNESPLGNWPYTGVVHLHSGVDGRHVRDLMHPNAFWGTHFRGPTVAVANPTPSRRATIFVAHLNGTAVYAFAACRADTDANGVVNSRDISAFIHGWLVTLHSGLPRLPPPGMPSGDYNGDGHINSADLAAFIADWLGQVGGCP